jgi:LmbE family N-acetylglucosaminyl deacetylase
VVRDMTVAVFFGAHADDIELGAAGTCAKLCAAGFDVRIVVATDDKNASIASSRRDEAIAAATILGIPSTRVHFLGLTDGNFRCNQETVDQVRAMFSALGVCPDAIFTHTEADSHQDHVELTRIAKAAFRRVGVFKYRVSNSAIPSLFRPSVRSEISAFLDVKSAALCQHKSQIIAGRVRLTQGPSNPLEAFELEVQEGAANFLTVLDRVDDAPFSRFWMPVCAKGKITVVAAPPQPRTDTRVASRAPSDLLLVTRLQTGLMGVLHTPLPDEPALSFTVEEANQARFEPPPFGASLILGGPSMNPAAQPFLEQIAPLRFRMDFASSEFLGHPIFDTHAGMLFGPSFEPTGNASLELTRDYGLLTIARVNNPQLADESSLVIAAMGVHAAGAAAAFSCLMLPEHLTRIVDDARRVIDGIANWAQWLIPCDGAGVPMISEIRHHEHEQRHARSESDRRSRTKRLAQAS